VRSCGFTSWMSKHHLGEVVHCSSLSQRSNDVWGPVQLLLQVAGVSRGTRACSGLWWWFSTLRGYTGLHAGTFVWVEKLSQLSETIKPTLQQPNEQGPVVDMGRYAHQWPRACCMALFPARTSNAEICSARRLPHWHRPQKAGLRHFTLHVTRCDCYQHNRVKGLVLAMRRQF
jgi:hypothetical protein